MTDKLTTQKVNELLTDSAVLLKLSKCADTARIAEVFRKKGLELTQDTASEVLQSLKNAGIYSKPGLLTDHDLEKVSGGIGPIEFPPRRRGDE